MHSVAQKGRSSELTAVSSVLSPKFLPKKSCRHEAETTSVESKTCPSEVERGPAFGKLATRPPVLNERYRLPIDHTCGNAPPTTEGDRAIAEVLSRVTAEDARACSGSYFQVLRQ
jgi:hypothetical protein